MPGIRVEVKPAIFEWVLQNINFENIKAKTKDDFFLWMAGKKAPTFNQLEQFSKATNIPFGYFFLSTPPIEKIKLLEYRTVDSLEIGQPSRNLIDTINEMEAIQEWMRDYVKGADLNELNYVGALKGNEDISSIASTIRESLRLSREWFLVASNAWDSFKLLRERLEDIGTIVMMNGIVGSNTHRSLDINEFRAFTIIDKYVPLIFINANDSSNGRLFSLAHEMTHIWLGVNSFYNDYQHPINGISSLEVLCNAVAAEILVPIEIFNTSWREDKTDDLEEKISNISGYFRCGTTVIARRALDQGLIDKATYTKLAESTIAKYRVKRSEQGSGGNYYNTLRTRLDNRLVLALSNSVYEGKTTFTEAYRLTNTSRKTFSALVEMVAGAEV
jgi:Zn-dependent peptidase ImmA (M78 family)